MTDDDRFAEIANAAPFPMWRSDEQGNCTVLNRAWSIVTGQTLQAGLRKGWMEYIHPGDIDAIKAKFRKASLQRSAYQAEYRLRHADGVYRWMVDSATPRLDGKGRLLGYIGSLVDIGDRKAAEIELVQAERRLRIATEAAGIGIWEWDLATNIFACSPRAIEIFGFSPDDQISFDHFRAVMHPDDLEKVQTASQRALDPNIRDSQPYRYRILRADTGEVRWVLAHAEASFDQAGATANRYTGTFQDVTDAYVAEQELRDSEARLRMALDAAGLVVWEVDLQSNRVTPSSDLNLFFGFAPEDEPTLDQLHDRYAPGEKERLAQLGENARAKGETALSTEFRFVMRDGDQRWALLLAQAAPPTPRSGPRAIGVLMDITERKRNEERLEAIAGELEHRVKNSLSVAQSLAMQTFRGIPSAKEPLERFLDRVQALASATHALAANHGAGAELSTLVQEITAPYRDKIQDPFHIHGGSALLDAQSATACSMALHELCTNAAKYGALTVPQGLIEICWKHADDTVELKWIESKGPAVTEPRQKGFGTKLLATLFPAGAVEHTFDRRGVRCSIRLPASEYRL
ncbi:PAS domain S-box protein [Pelagibacterium luteolum]|uniref:Blue-light-activated histidine kinase n=1 Tax=Pelagibacterium luteolum TaxID=440168 RepID=A0A1G8ALU8_9HYPH|nr:PAS domain S-box protein [Pelagibacterium luteolum]SDH21823.1 PAS domain S-box-containing protein [Pelagibacterium luteolum]